MKNLFILIWDEFKGFVKSKIMIALWVGLPVLSIIMYLLSPEGDIFPVSLFVGLFVASIGGLMAAVMLSSTMVNELNANVYDLFLIRPVKRWQIIIAKYIAVMVSLIIASLLSFTVGIIAESIQESIFPTGLIIRMASESLVMSIAAMSIACAAGMFIGMLVKSVALAVILSIYLGQQLSLVAVLPGVLSPNIDPLWFSLEVGFAVTIIILIAEIFVFHKKQF